MNQNVVRNGLKPQNLPTQWSNESMFSDDRMNGLTELLTVADICRKLGVSRAWVIEHSNGRRRPVIPSIKLGKVRRFDPTELEGFIDDCRRIGQTRVRNGNGRIQA